MKLLPMTARRVCCPCRACCTVLAIPEYESGRGEPCPQECAKGCRVHGSDAQPAACRAFSCGWLAGAGTDADRPDRLGVVMATGRKDATAVFYEAQAGALEKSRVKRLAGLLASQGIAAVAVPLPGEDGQERDRRLLKG